MPLEINNNSETNESYARQTSIQGPNHTNTQGAREQFTELGETLEGGRGSEKIISSPPWMPPFPRPEPPKPKPEFPPERKPGESDQEYMDRFFEVLQEYLDYIKDPPEEPQPSPRPWPPPYVLHESANESSTSKETSSLNNSNQQNPLQNYQVSTTQEDRGKSPYAGKTFATNPAEMEELLRNQAANINPYAREPGGVKDDNLAENYLQAIVHYKRIKNLPSNWREKLLIR